MRDNKVEFYERMQEFLPSTKEAYARSIVEYGDIMETIVIEDIFMPELLKLLSENIEIQLLKSIFEYFEEIVNSNDFNMIDIISITVFEVLGNDREILKNAKKYMGPKTTLLQLKADEDLGRN